MMVFTALSPSGTRIALVNSHLIHQPWKGEPHMLVLTRKINESIVIDNKIGIKIVKITGNRVRLAIEAPHDVNIDRAEVRERMQEFLEIDQAVLQA
jgi:carbon storage regulator